MERGRKLSNQDSESIKGRQILLSSSLDSSREVVINYKGCHLWTPKLTHLPVVRSLCVCMDRNVREPLQTVSMSEQRPVRLCGFGKSTQT